MKDLEKVQKTLSNVFDYLKGNNLQLVGEQLQTDVGDAHRIVENLTIQRVSNTFKAKIETEILMFETKLKNIKDDVEMAFTKPDQWTEEINLIKGRIDGLNSALNYC